MNRRLEFHPEARREALEAAIWYAQVRLELGHAFLDALDHAQQRILDAPDRWPLIARGHRRFLMHRFPYHVVYRVDQTRVHIIAIAHGHRRPLFWRHRR